MTIRPINWRLHYNNPSFGYGLYHLFVVDHKVDGRAFFFGDDDHLVADDGDVDMMEGCPWVKLQVQVFVFCRQLP